MYKTREILELFKGTLSEIERGKLMEWICDNEANKKQFIILKNLWSLSTQQSEPNSQDENAAWKKFRNRIKKSRNPGVKKTNNYLKYAAILIVAYGIGFTVEKALDSIESSRINAKNITTIQAPPGQSTQISLADGTKIHLNSNTRMTYTNNFSRTERTIFLQGEAFLEVAEDKTLPFIVQTEHLNVQVYGTSLNVEAYKNAELNVTLIEGKLGLNSKRGKEILKIKPGEMAVYEPQTRKLEVKKVDTNLYTSWRKGVVSFRNAPLCDIAQKIERWYNVCIQIENDELERQKYSGTLLKSKPVNQIIDALSLAATFSYTIQQRDDAPALIKFESKKEL